MRWPRMREASPSREAGFIARLRQLAGSPEARGLLDDAAVLPTGGADLVLTHDMLVEGVHFLATDPPADVAWKLVAVNLSDLAAKGAKPRGVLLGYSLTDDAGWDAEFVDGLGEALAGMDVPLLGGDTVAYVGGPRVLSLTAVGDAPAGGAPARGGARLGDDIWVSGTIGDAGAGLAIARGGLEGSPALLQRYWRPVPRVALGVAIAGRVTAMMDVSDGLLIDCARMAEASGVAAVIDLDAAPLSPEYAAAVGHDRSARLEAVTAGDDYELLFTAAPEARSALEACAAACRSAVTRFGTIEDGTGLRLRDSAGPVPLPTRLGYQHGDS